MDSKINTFYKNKTVFLTGGSGFLGRMIIEKLLRATEVKRIYILIRSKRGQEIKSRMSDFGSNYLFREVLKSNANYLERVSPIAGDCELPDLGLSEADRKMLAEEVQVVIHGAATVNFVELLSIALSINTRATRLVVQLAKEMRRLEAIVHVSTAFSNCVTEHIKESFYPELLTCTADEVLALKDRLSNKLLDKMTPALLGEFPNTYTFTKAMAEQVVQREGRDLPICIFRPGMILPSIREPSKGWIDNLYGPISIVYGAALGVVRVMILNREARSNIVPVDFCANLILASAWQTSVETAKRQLPAPDPPIYNFVPTEKNPLYWKTFTDTIENQRYVCPLNQMLWFPFLICTPSLWVFKILCAFYHHLPGFFIDIGLRLKGKQPRMKSIYKKIHDGINRLLPFVISSWSFDMTNSSRLLECMSPQDRKIYNFDMNSIDWVDYLTSAAAGIRVFLLKENLTEESLQAAQKLCKRLSILNGLAHIVAFSIPAAIIWWVLSLTYL
ncbi:fatty acyl-CoA reductase wat-like [Drosophila novamexicana]|uniref:fatty acyl-CoA reductase wat-like n=1 Tax=Drosophila novamexicana TaxID=47314 RepID=UPI0011E5E75A|nr:fatty acyl-CoA reductase wat-like [Drosophila novamexicana]